MFTAESGEHPILFSQLGKMRDALWLFKADYREKGYCYDSLNLALGSYEVTFKVGMK